MVPLSCGWGAIANFDDDDDADDDWVLHNIMLIISCYYKPL